MTDQQHPITPPPELTDKWNNLPLSTEEIFVIVARWGADQELEACCEYIAGPGKWFAAPWEAAFATEQFRLAELRNARRPKPPSLKEQALAVIENSAICDHLSPEHSAILRRALEQLND